MTFIISRTTRDLLTKTWTFVNLVDNNPMTSSFLHKIGSRVILSKESIKNIPPDKINEFRSFVGKTATVLRRELENQSILVIRFEDDSVKTVCSSWVYST